MCKIAKSIREIWLELQCSRIAIYSFWNVTGILQAQQFMQMLEMYGMHYKLYKRTITRFIYLNASWAISRTKEK